MFKNTYQSGLLSIFYSCGAHPLSLWEMEVNNGHIRRLTDSEVNSIVLEIVSTNVATTYITCPPKHNQTLGIKLPFLVMIVKNLKRYFSFEITILDDKNLRRRFRISNFQSTTKIKPFCTTMPIGLSGGWNQIQFNLSDFTRRAYGTQFIETLRVQVHANVRLRRIYFAERLYTEEELPQDYKLYLPLEKKMKKGKENKDKTGPEAGAPSPAGEEVAEPRKSLAAKKSTIEAKKSTTGRKSTMASTKTEEEPSEATAEAPAEGEAPPGEAPPEGETPAEGEAPPEGEAPAEGDAAPEEAPPEGEAPAEAPPEGEPLAETPAEVPEEAPVEAPAEAPAEEAPAAE